MALHVPRAPGFSSMMKDGARFFSGLEEAVIRNIGKTFYYYKCELNCRVHLVIEINLNYVFLKQMHAKSSLILCQLRMVRMG